VPTFSHSKNNALILTNNALILTKQWVGLLFGHFFHELIWSLRRRDFFKTFQPIPENNQSAQMRPFQVFSHFVSRSLKNKSRVMLACRSRKEQQVEPNWIRRNLGRCSEAKSRNDYDQMALSKRVWRPQSRAQYFLLKKLAYPNLT
jgi:hypothetical protein